MTETIDRDQVEHMAQVAAENALWHRRKYKATGDREHLGQWKAYARGAWCLRRVEYTMGELNPIDITKFRSYKLGFAAGRVAGRRVFIFGVVLAAITGAGLAVVLRWL